MQIDTPPARIIQAPPNLAGEIENSAIDERLSRLHNRMALAEFHGAYHTAQAKPEEFLQELDRNLLRHADQLRARNRTKMAEVKERFIELVFCQSKGKRNWKKDSICVNNWQSWGRAGAELEQTLVRAYQTIWKGHPATHAGRDDQSQASVIS